MNVVGGKQGTVLDLLQAPAASEKLDGLNVGEFAAAQGQGEWVCRRKQQTAPTRILDRVPGSWSTKVVLGHQRAECP
jgi:hypothetical protein